MTAGAAELDVLGKSHGREAAGWGSIAIERNIGGKRRSQEAWHASRIASGLGETVGLDVSAGAGTVTVRQTNALVAVMGWLARTAEWNRCHDFVRFEEEGGWSGEVVGVVGVVGAEKPDGPS